MLQTLRTVGKFNAIALFGAIATTTLFYLMQMLVLGDNTVPEREPRIKIQPVTLPDIIIDVVTREPRPPEIVDPPVIPTRVVDTWDKTPIGLPPVEIVKTGPEKFGPVELGPADANAMPITQFQPIYPTRALERGIEGFVIVEFDVSETGTVINARVLGADPLNIFDSAALRAVERWRYNPRFVDGRAVRMTGLQTRFIFSLRE